MGHFKSLSISGNFGYEAPRHALECMCPACHPSPTPPAPAPALPNRPTLQPVLAISGSRYLTLSHYPVMAGLIAIISPASIWTGCANGADSIATLAANRIGIPVRKFYASGPLPAQLAARSNAFIRATAKVPRAALLSFPNTPAPANLRPNLKSWQPCGSGSWSGIALALGLGIRVAIVTTHGPPPSLGAWRKLQPCIFVSQPAQLEF